MCSEESSYKSEEIRRETFHNRPVEFLDKNLLPPLGSITQTSKMSCVVHFLTYD